MINNLTLVGRTGGDPEMKTFSSGAIMATLNVAITRPAAKKEEKETDWFTVKVWGKQAEIVQRYVKKGHLIGIIGHLEQEKWKTDQGENRSKVIVSANQIKLMQPKADGSQAESGSIDAEQTDNDDIFSSSDEIPF